LEGDARAQEAGESGAVLYKRITRREPESYDARGYNRDENSLFVKEDV
jgi:hypothetical protein